MPVSSDGGSSPPPAADDDASSVGALKKATASREEDAGAAAFAAAAVEARPMTLGDFRGPRRPAGGAERDAASAAALLGRGGRGRPPGEDLPEGIDVDSLQPAPNEERRPERPRGKDGRSATSTAGGAEPRRRTSERADDAVDVEAEGSRRILAPIENCPQLSRGAVPALDGAVAGPGVDGVLEEPDLAESVVPVRAAVPALDGVDGRSIATAPNPVEGKVALRAVFQLLPDLLAAISRDRDGPRLTPTIQRRVDDRELSRDVALDLVHARCAKETLREMAKVAGAGGGDGLDGLSPLRDDARVDARLLVWLLRDLLSGGSECAGAGAGGSRMAWATALRKWRGSVDGLIGSGDGALWNALLDDLVGDPEAFRRSWAEAAENRSRANEAAEGADIDDIYPESFAWASFFRRACEHAAAVRETDTKDADRDRDRPTEYLSLVGYAVAEALLSLDFLTGDVDQKMALLVSVSESLPCALVVREGDLRSRKAIRAGIAARVKDGSDGGQGGDGAMEVLRLEG